MTAVGYLDASAIVKLIVSEAESDAILRWYIESDRIALALPDVDAFITYDDRQAEAARLVGLPVIRPA